VEPIDPMADQKKKSIPKKRRFFLEEMIQVAELIQDASCV
jgi:hypothetical protein